MKTPGPWSIPIDEKTLRLIETTPGMLERIEAEVNRRFLALLLERELQGK